MGSNPTRLADSLAIVIAQPKFRCDDGSEAQALSGPPLHEQLRGFGFSCDSPSDALRDSMGLEWTRAGAAAP